jgi:hypothetical protein
MSKVDLTSGPGRRRAIGQRCCPSGGSKITALMSNIAQAAIPHPVMIGLPAR